MVVLRPADHCDSRGCPEARALRSAWSAPPDHSLLAIVETYPYSQNILTIIDGQGPIRNPDPRPPHVADLLELE